ncbi:hypothetical protein [Cellulomonas endometrii]|uniref:hypothetical protein n=1 Tax=Cellulomonas endometrii TaxID=3036301 RepID=UPI0024AD1D02|nr:hypothetical protein [Cellulomonas endometrii]
MGLEYTVVPVPVSGQLGRPEKFVRETSGKLGEMAADGWHLVTVDQFWAYMERKTDED